jgi:hypothetical protein
MCRSIKTLRGADPPATVDDIEAASLQFVRKVSGYRHPSARNREVFERAVAQVADAVSELLEGVAGPAGALAEQEKPVRAVPASRG